MDTLIFVLEIIGVTASAVSGAFTAIRKEMDAFGVVILGLTTATGGGVIRDLL
ncbi:MAG: TRIC cation channel family protein, partial [Oscillospiraceae bacterium]|nr:TRIC cation channel family protein [Oscillospiraceae bacterium]